MTLDEAFRLGHVWAVAHGLDIFLASILASVFGTLAAFAGKLGRTDADGRFIADAMLVMAIVQFLVTGFYVFVAHAVLGMPMLALDAFLVSAPLASLVLTLVGLRLVFRFEQLAVVRIVRDLAAFLLACGVLAWLGLKFRGWGVLFIGGVFELLVLAVLAFLVLRRMWRVIGASAADASASGLTEEEA